MKKHGMLAATLAASFALAGCASGLLNNKSAVPQASNVPTGSQLSLPPDLQLPAPGTVRTAQAPASGIDLALADPNETPAPVTRAAPAAPQQDVYARYGISKVKPDGTAKTKEELQAELKAAILAEKRKANPRYGTVFNAGNIFKDE